MISKIFTMKFSDTWTVLPLSCRWTIGLTFGACAGLTAIYSVNRVLQFRKTEIVSDHFSELEQQEKGDFSFPETDARPLPGLPETTTFCDSDVPPLSSATITSLGSDTVGDCLEETEQFEDCVEFLSENSQMPTEIYPPDDLFEVPCLGLEAAISSDALDYSENGLRVPLSPEMIRQTLNESPPEWIIHTAPQMNILQPGVQLKPKGLLENLTLRLCQVLDWIHKEDNFSELGHKEKVGFDPLQCKFDASSETRKCCDPELLSLSTITSLGSNYLFDPFEQLDPSDDCIKLPSENFRMPPKMCVSDDSFKVPRIRLEAAITSNALENVLQIPPSPQITRQILNDRPTENSIDKAPEMNILQPGVQLKPKGLLEYLTLWLCRLPAWNPLDNRRIHDVLEAAEGLTG